MLKDPAQLLSHHGSCQNWCVCPKRGVADVGGGVSLGVGKGPCRTSRPTPATGDLPPSSGQSLHALTPSTPIRMHATGGPAGGPRHTSFTRNLHLCYLVYELFAYQQMVEHDVLATACTQSDAVKIWLRRLETQTLCFVHMLSHQPRFHHAFTQHVLHTLHCFKLTGTV